MKSNRFGKVISFMLALILCFSCLSFSALAADLKEENNSPEFQTIEEAGITREEAMEVLKLTPEEAKGVNFYALTNTNQLVFESGDAYTFPRFTFTDYNIGQYFTVNANQLMFGVIWELPSDQPAATLNVDLYPYDEPSAYNIYLSTPSAGSEDKRLTARSEWIDTYYGVDYHFVYEADAWAWDPRSVTSSVTVVIGLA